MQLTKRKHSLMQYVTRSMLPFSMGGGQLLKNFTEIRLTAK